MKKTYTLPEIQVLQIMEEDIITASGKTGLTGGGTTQTGMEESFNDFVQSLQ